ncbi:thioredoxin-disulfide reductase [Desulfofundulus sp. TPOSR]|uniref:Thioredoxin reductase n=1 Tax=Desulfofundulus kuznetsovii (strain DSM 6115 / VKM B-1805 / 17) TaxID=760568 RepID=A0AAU8Q295_DESK7|nr:thioredoxin-disulfide reductase [Desulfofundulus sp. TPOSR]AEG15028.1 thioredoxin reductase [Desulfofundulus kuznetsovii DSM 6115]NHM25527.1 thioredoxin-disulfide reductase [Desulfofundulus sp. TPOSR]
MYDVAIIGGGPAGLTAGIYAARAKLKSLLIERGMTGGLAATTEFIENYPGFSEGIGGPELMSRMEAQARRFGLEFLNSNVEALKKENLNFIVKTEDTEIAARTVIVATGAQPQRLNVRGEETFYGRGVSYCATCDGAFFKDKHVAVVGGGDAAVEEAMFLTKFATRVFIIHRRGELRATKIVQERARQNPRIEFIWHNVVEEITGKETVTGVRIKDVRTGQTSELPVDGVFIYIGYNPNSYIVKELVKLDERGYILTDANMQTSCPGLFAAGDVRQKSLRQVVTAVADGAIAAVSAEKYLEQNR